MRFLVEPTEVHAVSSRRDLGSEDHNVKTLALPLVFRELDQRLQSVYHRIPVE